MSLRPGSAAARLLMKSDDAAKWTEAAGGYPTALAAVGKSRKKEKELTRWDAFVTKEMAKAKEEKMSKLTKEQLIDIVNWKLTRGKFR